MQEHLLDRLRCPENQQRLAIADETTIQALNTSIEEKALHRQDGTLITEPLESGLIREDGLVLYPIRSGLPSLLLQEAIAVGGKV